MIVHIDNKITPSASYASERTRGLYNVGVEDGARFRMDVDLPVEQNDWQIGVVVGPSGSGKTSIARALESGQNLRAFHAWEPEWTAEPVIDVLARKAGEYAKATAAFAAVGLGSVPSWLRPRYILSNGEGFRADLAGLLVSGRSNVYIDEFTSILDRQVAKVGAGAFARAWRRVPDRRIVLLSPHYDILEWIEPDWWVDTAEGADEFPSDRGVVQARKGSFQETIHHARDQEDWVATLEC